MIIQMKAILPLILILSPTFINPVFSAAAFDPTDQPLGSIGPIELSSSDISTEPNAYRIWYENGTWQGDLVEYDIATTGQMSTTIDLSTGTPSQGGSVPATDNWSANVKFAELAAASSSYWDTGREIITSNAGTQVAFRWNNLSATQKAALDPGNTSGSSVLLDFIRGDQSREFGQTNALFRKRFSLLGDIIHSNPEYVKRPQGQLLSESYATFINNKKNRSPRVYVGANDGMLHAFDATTGQEAWAYIPSNVIANLKQFSIKPFVHHYYVDGQMAIQDALIGSAWHTVLVSSLGSGGKGIFALDVTHPDLSDENSNSGTNDKLLWEITNDTDLGYIFGNPVIAKLGDNQSWAVFGNGVMSNSGKAVLYLVNIATGAIRKHVADSGTGNGLSAPALVDANKDGKVDFAYAGDINGDMYRFDLSATTIVNSTYQYKVYDGVETQPITTAPDISSHPVSGYLVLFATGRLYSLADVSNSDAQAIIGVRDTGYPPASPSVLTQTLSNDIDYTTGGADEKARAITPEQFINSNAIWKVALPAGERSLTAVQVRGGRVKAVVSKPENLVNWLFEVDYRDGGNAATVVFDLNKDGLLNATDRVDANKDGDLLDNEDIPVARRSGDGHMSALTIARLYHGMDTGYINFLQPPVVPAPTPATSCTGLCEGGLAGGHFDFDTDESHMGGMAHEHEYDDTVNATYADYFDVPNNVSNTPINNAVSNTEEFIILVANADLSPGAVLTIKDQHYHIVDYQKMIHKKLAAWDGSGPLTDDNGKPLIHNVNSVRADGGTIRYTFNSRALFDGGLVPSKPPCVKSKNMLTPFGRYRGGSLLLQLVKKSWLIAQINASPGSKAIDHLHIQNITQGFFPSPAGIDLFDDSNSNGIYDAGSDNVYPGAHLPANSSATAGFLYESSLYWHYGKRCLDHPDYDAAVAAAREDITEHALDDLGLNNFAELESAINALLALGCTSSEGTGCSEYNELMTLYELMTNGSDSGDSTPDKGEAEPYIMGGTAEDTGPTAGPNFKTGRRAWIDLRPQ